jgi:hypothetical protein
MPALTEWRRRAGTVHRVAGWGRHQLGGVSTRAANAARHGHHPGPRIRRVGAATSTDGCRRVDGTCAFNSGGHQRMRTRPKGRSGNSAVSGNLPGRPGTARTPSPRAPRPRVDRRARGRSGRRAPTSRSFAVVVALGHEQREPSSRVVADGVEVRGGAPVAEMARPAAREGVAVRHDHVDEEQQPLAVGEFRDAVAGGLPRLA